ncbi:hypothetical protein BD780_002084 [Clostridium tetanomorphum]|uniref:GerMN domain-containing protein n=1 Tax=Clostridium tetanomorphum TaxID=1553 RepID=UPI0004465999|nr:GerMN domain-containing protein [Clostridium tetanomorphum]KAJ52791.1 hypothetical protein CTM_05640 [Clostridium tetanomorphum DSM 665]MBP1865374.1 hypothetical protein [Clostridium tetanomorphum]NRS84859.1 hypothetical protein [Clostridium tetanomorphum]SQB91626.1 sporulation/spore germination protein [Clostridium tetanomorphum]
MKKFILILLLPFVLLTSCNKPNTVEKDNNTKIENPASNKDVSKMEIKNYYPFKENVRLKYKGTGNEFAERSVYTDYISDNRIQLRVVNPGTTSAQVLEIKDGELRLITSKSEFYYRDNIINTENKEYEVLLKEPLVKGTSWNLPNGNKRYISDTEKEIETPYGKFKALEVTTESNEDKIFDYYAVDKGLVKTVFNGKGLEVITELESIQENTPVTQTVKFYYPNIVEDKIVSLKRTLNFNTNDDLKTVLEKNFKEVPDKNMSKLIMSDNIKINKIFLDAKTNTVNIDLSDNYVKEMNFGSASELATLKSITNTLGDYYNVDKVYITLGGKPYSSGHMLMKENETFKVDFTNISEYNK